MVLDLASYSFKFLTDNGIRPHKLLRPVSSSEPVMENGRKLEPCQTDIPSTSGRQGAASNGIMDIKEHRLNGLVGPQRPNACSMRSSSTTVQVNENGEASAKPPLVRPQQPNAYRQGLHLLLYKLMVMVKLFQNHHIPIPNA